MGVNASVTEAQDVGLGAWTLDPATCIVSGSFVATTQYLASFYWRPGPGVAPFPTKILLPNVIVGSWTLVQTGIICQDQVGQNGPGTLLASCVAVLPTAGLTSTALVPVAAAPAILPQGRYWVALVVTGTTGTALAASNPGTSGSLGINMGTDVAHSRFGIAATIGALVNIVPATIVSTTSAGLCLCAGVA
jgi:hypothetical protein